MPKEIFEQRQQQLHTLRKRAGLDAIALVPGANLTYLTGLPWHASERATLALLAEAGLYWLVPTLEAAKLQGHAADVFAYSDHEGPAQAAEALAVALGGRGLRLGMEPLHMRVFEHDMLARHLAPRAFEDATPLLSQLRSVKDANEVQNLKRAMVLTEAILQKTIDAMRPGQSELEVAMRFQQLAYAHQAHASFPPIVASGPNGGNPHAVPGGRTIQVGDVVTLDVGVYVEGYPGDITRNVAVGPIDPVFEALHDVVLQANRAGVAAAGPGVPAQQVDQAARAVIEAAGYGAQFIHRTGHGLGLEVHEPPYIVAGNDAALVPGNVFTVEPGVYLPQRGGVRVEDDCLITETGVEVLTTFPRELIRI